MSATSYQYCVCSGCFCRVNSYNLIPFTVYIANWQLI